MELTMSIGLGTLVSILVIVIVVKVLRLQDDAWGPEVFGVKGPCASRDLKPAHHRVFSKVDLNHRVSTIRFGANDITAYLPRGT
jgi:hypothetical protein